MRFALRRDALRTDPYDDTAWDLSGRVLAEKGAMPEAIYDFERAVRLRPGYAPYLYDFALALVRADRFDEAQRRAEEALRADPNLADAHELLGVQRNDRLVVESQLTSLGGTFQVRAH